MSLHTGQSRPAAGIPDPGNSGPEDGVRRFPPGGATGGGTRHGASASTASSWAALVVLSRLCVRRPRRAADQGPPALGRRRPARRRPAPVLHLDPRGAPPRPDRQPLRPRARRPRVPAPRLRHLRRPARARAVRPARPTCCGSRSRSGCTFCGRAPLRPAPDPARPGARHAALILALFAVMPASWLVAWSDWGGNPRQYTFDFISGEMWSGQYLWGYLMTAIAVFLMPLVLLAHERGRTGWAAAGALLVVLAAAVAGRDPGADRPRRRRVAAPARRARSVRPARRGRARRDRSAGLLLPAARPLRPRLGARGEVERRRRDARVELAVVGGRAHARAARRPRRARLPAARAELAGAGGAGVAVRGARRLPAAVRDVPLPLVPGARPAALDPRGPGPADGLAPTRARSPSPGCCR